MESINVILLGNSGSGKSTFVNAAIEKKIFATDDIFPCAKKWQMEKIVYRDHIINLIDFPGFNDTCGSEIPLILNLIDFFKKTNKISYILIFHKLTAHFIKSEIFEYYNNFLDMKKINCIIILTETNTIENNNDSFSYENKTIEEYVKHLGIYFAKMLNKNIPIFPLDSIPSKDKKHISDKNRKIILDYIIDNNNNVVEIKFDKIRKTTDIIKYYKNIVKKKKDYCNEKFLIVSSYISEYIDGFISENDDINHILELIRIFYRKKISLNQNIENDFDYDHKKFSSGENEHITKILLHCEEKINEIKKYIYYDYEKYDDNLRKEYIVEEELRYFWDHKKMIPLIDDPLLEEIIENEKIKEQAKTELKQEQEQNSLFHQKNIVNNNIIMGKKPENKKDENTLTDKETMPLVKKKNIEYESTDLTINSENKKKESFIDSFFKIFSS
jgi:Predicted GTPase